MSIERIFAKEMTLKEADKHAIQHVRMLVIVLPTLSKLRHTRWHSMYMNTYLLAESNDEKVSNYKLAKAVGLTDGRRTTDEAYEKAYEHRKNISCCYT